MCIFIFLHVLNYNASRVYFTCIFNACLYMSIYVNVYILIFVHALLMHDLYIYLFFTFNGRHVCIYFYLYFLYIYIYGTFV